MQSLSIAILQTSLFWEDRAQNLRAIGEKLAALPSNIHLTILPEMFSTGFSMNPSRLAETMEGSTIQWMKQVAAEKKTSLTGSTMI